jgi:hypothetical protein
MGLNENQIENDFTGKENNLKDYIKLINDDDDPKNLNIDYIHNNWRFSQFLNKILFEIYKNNLGMNLDNSKLGITGVHTLNTKTDWSILNYFAGHKFIKNELLMLFDEKNKEQDKTPKDFFKWILMNKEELFKNSNILDEFIKTNMYTYNKGSVIENFVINILQNKDFELEYYPPGSSYDRDHGIDLKINGVTYQLKQLLKIDEDNEFYYLFTPQPKDYLGKSVQRIMLVDIETANFVSFPNRDYTIDEKKGTYTINQEYDDMIKLGNLKKL